MPAPRTPTNHPPIAIPALALQTSDAFAAAAGDPDLLRPALGVEAQYLEAAFEEMESRFGSIEGYFEKGLELSDETLDALRAGLVRPAD
ncbi:MAG: tyrosine-protein phosphatase [Microthrixaceae bacterium]|nr:tyrosine-protein phosphatase [Microthrixaceae bacterium]